MSRIGVRVCGEKCCDLILQSITDTTGQIGEMQCVWCIVCDLEQSALDAGVAVLQAEIEDGSVSCRQFPNGLTLGHLETDPKG